MDNIKSNKLNTHFNRGAENHNLEFNKHNIKLEKHNIKPVNVIFIIALSLFGLTSLSALALLSSNSHADTTSATASVTVPDTCYLSSNIEPGHEHADTLSGGEYKANIGETTVSVVCNDRNGYSVYAIGCSGSDATNCSDTNKTKLIGASTNLTIPTGLSTDGSTSNWAMKLTAVTGTFAPTILNGYNNYSLVPATATKVATLTSDINVSNSSQFKTTYAVAIASSQAADTYVGKVKYTVVHPNYTNADGTLESLTCTKQYRLQNADGTYPDTYTADGSETITASNTCSYSKSVEDYQTQSTSATVIAATTLSLDLPRNTYALTVNRNTTYISSVSGAGTYRWGQSVSISATASSDNKFTSWSQTAGTTSSFGSTTSASTTFTMPKSAATIYADGKSSKLYMWDATSADCGTTMYDNRDGTERAYTTAKIGSLCWMTQNLMLGASSSVTLYKATTNITANTYTLPARGTSGTSSSGQYVWGNDTQCTSSSTTACAGYYSYAAATAGTNPSSGAASSDICPAGWRLPTEAELSTLKNSYSTGSALTGSPFLGVYAGRYYNRSLSYGGSYGHYWSSVAHYASGCAYDLDFSSSSADVTLYDKSLGYSVRCVAKS